MTLRYLNINRGQLLDHLGVAFITGGAISTRVSTWDQSRKLLFESLCNIHSVIYRSFTLHNATERTILLIFEGFRIKCSTYTINKRQEKCLTMHFCKNIYSLSSKQDC